MVEGSTTEEIAAPASTNGFDASVLLQDVVEVERSEYPSVVAEAMAAGFVTFVDLCGVDGTTLTNTLTQRSCSRCSS